MWTYFSAVCWFYGKYLYEQLNVPIGLVSPNWGGTPIECWSSPKALQNCGLNIKTEYAQLYLFTQTESLYFSPEFIL